MGAREEVEVLRGELARARVREREMAGAVEEERQTARKKVAELEGVIDRTDREHALFRERTELRLERLRVAVEEEDEENGSQVCVTYQVICFIFLLLCFPP